jgi:hypothetical protein
MFTFSLNLQNCKLKNKCSLCHLTLKFTANHPHVLSGRTTSKLSTPPLCFLSVSTFKIAKQTVDVLSLSQPSKLHITKCHVLSAQIHLKIGYSRRMTSKHVVPCLDVLSLSPRLRNLIIRSICLLCQRAQNMQSTIACFVRLCLKNTNMMHMFCILCSGSLFFLQMRSAFINSKRNVLFTMFFLVGDSEISKSFSSCALCQRVRSPDLSSYVVRVCVSKGSWGDGHVLFSGSFFSLYKGSQL